MLLSPGRDVAVSFWLPGRWWRLAARMLAFLVVFLLAVLVPSVVLSHLFEVDVVPALAVMGAVVAVVTVALASVDSRAHRGRGPQTGAGMVSITGLASRSGTAWGSDALSPRRAASLGQGAQRRALRPRCVASARPAVQRNGFRTGPGARAPRPHASGRCPAGRQDALTSVRYLGDSS